MSIVKAISFNIQDIILVYCIIKLFYLPVRFSKNFKIPYLLLSKMLRYNQVRQEFKKYEYYYYVITRYFFYKNM